MNPLVFLLYMILKLYGWALLIWIILTWLINFNVVNRYNRFISTVEYLLFKLTDPVLGYVRRYIRPTGGIDIAPIVVFLLIYFLQYTLVYYFS